MIAAAALLADAVAFPIPAPAGTPPWVGVLFLLAGLATFAVLVWQAVRYFRENGDEQPRGDQQHPRRVEPGSGDPDPDPDPGTDSGSPYDRGPDRPHDPPR